MVQVRHFDLCVIGSGSGNSVVDSAFDQVDVALIESGAFGGTCVNVGCIPTKMLVYPADLASSPPYAARLGVDLALRDVRWAEMRDRIFSRVDEISADGLAHRHRTANVTVFRDEARFVGLRTLRVGTETLLADRFVIAAGSRPRLPDIAGLDAVTVHTSDTVMRLERLPGSMLIVGGGAVAAEFAHIFSAFGTAVTVAIRSETMLRREDADIAARFTDLLARRVEIRRRTRVQSVGRTGTDGVRAELVGDDGRRGQVEADVLLVATGRTPNGDRLSLDAAGVAVDDDGFAIVDQFQRTTAAGVFALGDVSSHYQLKHVANHEARVVRHNLLHPDAMTASDHRFVPHAIFSDPQVASVGMTEAQAGERGAPYAVGRCEFAETAYGWAMEDCDHFVKVVADPGSGLLLGAHLVGPQASSLIQPLIQAMSFGQRVEDVAHGQYWIHPAMAEVVENALLAV